MAMTPSGGPPQRGRKQGEPVPEPVLLPETKSYFSPMFNVYDYADYRRLLADYCRVRREADRAFTVRGFLLSAGFTGPNYLKEVIDGKKNLSLEGVDRFAAAMELGERETVYFRLLVDFNQTRDPERKRAALLELADCSPHAEVADLARDQYEVLSQWYYVAVREYVHAHRVRQGEEGEMGDRLQPPVGKRQINKALKVLQRLQLVRLGDEGYWQATSALLTTGSEVKSLAARDFHRAMLELARVAIDEVGPTDRHFRAITGSFSHQAYERIVLEMEIFRGRVQEIIAADRDDLPHAVHHLGLQLFPLEQKPESEGAAS